MCTKPEKNTRKVQIYGYQQCNNDNTETCMLDLVWMALEGNGTNEPCKQVQIGANMEFVNAIKCSKLIFSFFFLSIC